MTLLLLSRCWYSMTGYSCVLICLVEICTGPFSSAQTVGLAWPVAIPENEAQPGLSLVEPGPSSAYFKYHFTSGCSVVLEESNRIPETETHQPNSNRIYTQVAEQFEKAMHHFKWT